MRDRVIVGLSTLTLLMGLGWYSSSHAQTAQMAREEPHMSAAVGHLEQAKAELEKATPTKGGHREKAMQLVDEAVQQVREGERYFEQEHR